jgi:hypothetical protein
VDRHRLVLVGLASLVAIALVVGGFALGRSSGRGDDTTAGKIVSTGHFSVRLPPTWREPGDRVNLSGLALDHPIAFSPSASANRATLVLGVSRILDSSLLLSRVRQALSGPVELHVTRRRDGAMTAICVGEDPTLRRACEGAVASVRVPAVDSDVDLQHQRVLDHAVRHLNDARVRGIRAMRAAHRAKVQASAAYAVGEAYEAAAQEVADGSRDPSNAVTRTRIVSAFDGAASAWLRLADVARDGSAPPYEVASFLVESSESWARAALAEDVRSTTALHVSAVGTSPRNTQPAPTAHAKPCAPEYPVQQDVRDKWQQIVRVCSNDAGTSLLVKNKSTLVLVIHHDGHATYVGQEPDSLTGNVVAIVVPSECGGTPCSLVPDGSLRIDASQPVHVDFDIAFDQSATAAFARVVAGKVEDRLTAPAVAKAQQVATCVTGVKSMLDDQDWQDRLRRLVTDGPGCKKLAQSLYKTEPDKQQRLAKRLITYGREYSGGTWVDGLIFGADEVWRLLRIR